MRRFFRNIFIFAKKYITVVIIAFLFLFLFICNNTSFRLGNELMDNLKSIATSFTPTTDLFDDGSEVSFVSYFFGMKAKVDVKRDVKYFYPVNAQNLSTDSYSFLFNFDGLVYSAVEGRVRNVGFNENGEKYVEVEQTDGKISRYDGLDMVGVAIGDFVFANKPIGIASYKNYLKFSIFDQNEVVDLSEIEWIR